MVQDYDIPFTANFVEAMHEAIKNARDLVVLYTGDYEASPHTRKEFTSFEADRAQSAEERRVVILRCEDVPLRGPVLRPMSTRTSSALTIPRNASGPSWRRQRASHKRWNRRRTLLSACSRALPTSPDVRRSSTDWTRSLLTV